MDNDGLQENGSFDEKSFAFSHTMCETVQDFLIKLSLKPLMHLLEIIIFSLNNNIVRLNKIISFQVIFQCLKLVESFQKKKKFCEEYLIRRPTCINEFFLNFDF